MELHDLKYPNLDAERARLGLSMAQLADCLGVSRKTVYNWMRRGSIPQEKLWRMTQLFGCRAEYLLEGRAR